MLCISIAKRLSRELGDGGGIVAGRESKSRRPRSGRSERGYELEEMSVMKRVERINREGEVWW